jgi:hypothetical protein
MLVVIRDGGEELSPKASFVAKLFRSRSNTRFLYVFRKEEEKFREKWGYNQIELATSTTGILLYYFLMVLQSPKDLRDGLLRRLFHRRREHVLIKEGFLSVLSQALYQYFARSARTDGLIRFLKKLNSPKIFLIDEFWSLNSVNLKELKNLGLIIYLSQDLAHNRFGFGENFRAKKLMYKLERNAIALADVVIACSERDRLKYVEMGARKAIFYPNIYPITEFEPCDKDQTPTISIVLPKHWGPRADRSLEKIFKALSYVDRKIRVYLIGIQPQRVPRNIELQYYKFIPNKSDYLRTLSKSWVGINIGIHKGGTNERKYDYAMAGTVVLSDNLSARGDLLPYEYTYVDSHDLAAKSERLLEFGQEKIAEMGIQNRKEVISLAEKQRDILLRMVKSIVIAQPLARARSNLDLNVAP